MLKVLDKDTVPINLVKLLPEIVRVLLITIDVAVILLSAVLPGPVFRVFKSVVVFTLRLLNVGVVTFSVLILAVLAPSKLVLTLLRKAKLVEILNVEILEAVIKPVLVLHTLPTFCTLTSVNVAGPSNVFGKFVNCEPSP